MQNGLDNKGEIDMLSRRYVERRKEKKAFWNPGNGKLFVEGAGLLTSNHAILAEACTAAIAYQVDVLYLMPCRGRWTDQRGQYPGKKDWEISGLHLDAYFRNHAAVVGLESGKDLVDVVPIGLWFPSYQEGMYMSDVIKVMRILQELLEKHFQGIDVVKGKHESRRVEILTTPARTGMDLLRRKLPYGAKYEDLPPEVENIIMSQFGQARTELFHHGREVVDNLHNYDGRWMYASCCRHMPVGGVVHDDLDRFEPYVPGFYRVEARVPHNWNHIGLLPVREGNRAVYPNKPGTSFESWCSHRQLQLALSHQWEICCIEERILWPDTHARGMKIGQDPLRHWMETLVKLREEMANEYDEPIRSFLRDGFRSLLNQPIGRLHMGKRKVDVYTQNYAEDPGEGAHLVEEFEDGSCHYQKNGELTNYQRENFKPHWALAIWTMAQWKVTRAALQVPYDQLVSIRTDGIWTTCQCGFDDTGKPGCFREKPLKLTGPFDWPSGPFADVQFIQMIQRSRNG